MAEKIKKITFDVFGKEYEFAGGGGEGSQPAHDSVGSEEIKNGSVQMEDLDPRIMTTPQEARDIVAAAIAKEE